MDGVFTLWVLPRPFSLKWLLPHPQLSPDFLDFRAQSLVLCLLALQEASGESGFVVDAFGGEYVQVAALVRAFTEIFGFDQALFDQSLQAVVHLAQADTQCAGELTLADIRVGLQCLEYLVAGVVGEHILFLSGLAVGELKPHS